MPHHSFPFHRSLLSFARSAALVALALLVVSPAPAQAQSDQLHYIPPFFARKDLDEQFVLVTTTETTPFSVTMKDGAGNVLHTFTNVSRTTPGSLDLAGSGYDQTGVLDQTELNTITNEGLILTADSPFSVNVRHEHGLQGMSVTSKGTFGLGTDFRSGHLISNNSANISKAHVISVMATVDDTTVSFSDIRNQILMFGQAGTDYDGETPNPFPSPAQVTLDAGESYVIAYEIDNPSANSANDHNDANGIHVTSDKPIAMNSGSWLGGNQSSGKDIGMDQVVPIGRIGTAYAVVRGNGGSNEDTLERPGVVAAYDNTEVFAGGVSQGILANAGDYLYISHTAWSASGNMFITTSQPAYLYQSTSANSSDGNGLSFIPPLRCNGSQDVVIAQADQLGNSSLGIIGRAGASVSVNGVPLTGAQPFPEPLTGCPIAWTV